MVNKLEVTLSIDGKVVNAVKHTGPVDIGVIGNATSMITTELMEVINKEQAEALAADHESEVASALIEAEAEAQEREQPPTAS